MQHHRGSAAQVVKHRGGFVKKQRQVILDAGGGHAVAHVLVDAAFGRVTVQQLTPAAAKTPACVVVHREFTAGQQAHLGHGVQRALAVGVKRADAVDLIVKQINAKRHQRAHGKQINQPAAHRVFPGADHLRDMAVTGQRELRLEPRLVQLLFDSEFKGVARQKAGWGQAVQRRGGGHDHHVRAGFLVALLDAPQRGQPFADQVLVR